MRDLSVWFDLAVQAVAIVLLGLCTGGLVFILVAAATGSGPNCPGKDPSWIGWCSEAPDAW